MAKSDSKRQVIPAVGYCRKSTSEEGHEKSIADQKGRIRQLKPPVEGARYEIVRWYEKDAGVPGWKRGAKRPDYFKLVGELKETGAKAILVDDMDRFSRADPMDTVRDVSELRDLGVRYLHAVNQGCRDLVEGGGMVTMQIALESNASHEFSTRLSRRIANARLDAAKQGLRSGGVAPYGLRMADEKGRHVTPGPKKKGEPVGRTVVPGDPKQVKVVRQIFDWFVKHLKSMNWIAAELNRQKIPARHGGQWYVATVKELLRRREYRGDFTFNHCKSGQFHIINSKHEVVPVFRYQDEQLQPWKPTTDGLFVKEGVYKPLIAPKVYDATQKRLAGFALKGNRRPRENGFPLSGILICDHCGKPMYGCTPTGRDQRVYRCSTPAKTGSGSCGNYWVDEANILPFILWTLGEEIDHLGRLTTPCPKELIAPKDSRKERAAELERQVGEIKTKIDQAEDIIMCVKPARSRQSMDGKLEKLWGEHDRIVAELEAAGSDDNGSSHHTLEEAQRLADWWQDFCKRSVLVPLDPAKYPNAAAFHAAWDDGEPFGTRCDGRAVNEALHELGAEVRLRWQTEKITLSNGKVQNRYTLVRGRFRLGQRQGEIPGKNGVKFCKVPPAEGCSGNSAACRPGSRTGIPALPFCQIRLMTPKPPPDGYPRDPKTLGDHLRKRRIDLKLMQKDVAKRLGADEATVWNWENNRWGPSLRFIPTIINFLGYDPHHKPVGNLMEDLVAFRRRRGLTQKELAAT